MATTRRRWEPRTWRRSSPTTVTTPSSSGRAGVQRGKDGIRQAFTKLLGEVPQATWDIKTTIYEGDILLLEWGAEGGGNRIQDGIDTFVFRDGLIQVQTASATAAACSLMGGKCHAPGC